MRVLIIEDEPRLAQNICRSLRESAGYAVDIAPDGQEGLFMSESNDYDAILLDLMLPHMDGMQLLQRIRKAGQRTPVLVVTARDDKESIVALLNAGADDYLTKPFSAEELRARLYAGERIVAVQQQLTTAREALREQAIRDCLTGLFNRRYLEEALGRELRRAGHGDERLSILMLDLDHFKNLNDLHGHAAGDAVLKQVGMILDTHTRREDIVCRYGGEEFVLILPGAASSVASRRADELRQAIGRARLESQGEALGSITVSIGVAGFPEHGTTAEALLGAADQALYRAKHEGRNRVVVHDAAQP